MMLTSVILPVRADKETAARITEEIGNLMKEIETLVEEKKKDSSEMSKIITPQEGKYLTRITSDLDVNEMRVHWFHIASPLSLLYFI